VIDTPPDRDMSGQRGGPAVHAVGFAGRSTKIDWAPMWALICCLHSDPQAARRGFAFVLARAAGVGLTRRALWSTEAACPTRVDHRIDAPVGAIGAWILRLYIGWPWGAGAFHPRALCPSTRFLVNIYFRARCSEKQMRDRLVGPRAAHDRLMKRIRAACLPVLHLACLAFCAPWAQQHGAKVR